MEAGSVIDHRRASSNRALGTRNKLTEPDFSSGSSKHRIGLSTVQSYPVLSDILLSSMSWQFSVRVSNYFGGKSWRLRPFPEDTATATQLGFPSVSEKETLNI